jgi:hypothetical protein
MPSFDYNIDFKIPFRNYVLEDLELNSIINNRFYGSQLATLFEVPFPMAVFYSEGGSVQNLGIVKRFTVVIRAYSDKHFDEAYTIHKAISERLGGENGPKYITNNITIRPTSTIVETYENDPRIYGVGSRFGVVWIS